MKAALGTSAAALPSPVALLAESSTEFPLRSEFPITATFVYLNAGAAHPLNRAAIAAIQAYLQEKAAGSPESFRQASEDVRIRFATLNDTTLDEHAIPDQSHEIELYLDVGVPRRGYECVTPEKTRLPMISFSYAAEKREAISAKLKKANIGVKVDQRVIRVSPSIYNDASDIDKLLAALA
jgi:selenocysteine lyase/cysteine desulfurase